MEEFRISKGIKAKNLLQLSISLTQTSKAGLLSSFFSFQYENHLLLSIYRAGTICFRNGAWANVLSTTSTRL